jgi:hypothetical protein
MMRIVDRKTFLKLHAGITYSKYEPCVLGPIEIKGDTLRADFFSQQISDAVACESSEDFYDILLDAEKNGTNFDMDFNCEGRDGMYDEDQLFAIWGDDDVRALINRLAETIS